MGTIRKSANKYRAEVCVNGKRRSKRCHTKAAAQAWILATEQALAEGLPAHTVAELFERYVRAVSIHKRTYSAEAKRAARLTRELGGAHLLTDLTRDALATWRDTRLAVVSPGAVRRDWALLNHALNLAVTEWEWLRVNPLAALKRPAKPAPRNRVWSGEAIARFLYCAGHPGETLQARIGDALLFALETGLRAGEITRIRPAHVFERHVHIPRSKNGGTRDVPLSSRAKAILEGVGNDFGLTDGQLNALFRKARDRAGLTDLRFHDARRTALTALSKRFDALELARISGHRDLRILLETYYAPAIEDLADKLD